MVHNLTRRLVGALGIAALAMACWQMAERYLLPKLGSVWVEEVVISREVVEGTARPLYIYADRANDAGASSA